MVEHKGAQHWLDKDRGIKAKITEEQVEEIMIDLRGGKTYGSIATDFNTHECTVQAINEGRYKKYRVEGYSYPVRTKKVAIKYTKEDDVCPDEYVCHV